MAENLSPSEHDPGLQEKDAELPALAKVNYKRYPGRYYVLAVTALLATIQNVAWLTFGPIPVQAQEKYGLTDAELTLLPRK